MNADVLIRVATSAVVSAVAAFAAVVSYSHIYDLARQHGEAGTAGRLLPLSVDGLILAASLVALHEARAGRSVPGLARVALALGIAATVAANVAYGLGYGWIGALISAWPAIGFIFSAELLMTLVRRARVPESSLGVPVMSNGSDPLAQRFRPYLEAGQIPGIRTIKKEMGVGQEKATEVRGYLESLSKK